MKVRATTILGGWDNAGCGGRPSERVATLGVEGEVLGDALWMLGSGEPWKLVRFDLDDGPIWVGAVEGAHFEAIQ